MRILYLSQLLPYPLDAGPKVRSYYVLRHLAKTHHVTLLAFTRPDDTHASIQHLREFCEDIQVVLIRRSQARNLTALASSLVTGQSFVIRRDFVPEMAKAVDRLLQTMQFDAVHADQLWMAQYALRAQEIARGAALVLDEHNACFQIVLRLATGERNPLKHLILEHECRAMQRYEIQACAQFDHIVTVTEDDRAILEPLVSLMSIKQTSKTEMKTPRFSTIPICVDTLDVKSVVLRIGVKDVLHLGTMFWLPNVEGVLWFTREVWPKVVAQVPEATFTIVGKNPPPEIQALSNGQNGGSPIKVTGYVPDPQPYLERSGVFIVPLLSGGGMRVKIVDAWRWGLPIVSTSTGAEGIDCVNGDNILIADSPEAFASAVVRVLCDPTLAQRLRENGRRWVEQHYDWRQVYPAWDAIYPPALN